MLGCMRKRGEWWWGQNLATWQTVETGIAGTGGQVQRFYSTRGQGQPYFRVEEAGP